jgi:prephenate dehydrogenase
MLEAMRDHLAPHAVVTDGGSTKARVVDLARAALGARIAQFVPGHPIAGSDRSGAAAADARLYHGRRTVLTPVPENTAATIARVRDAWSACGAEVVEMTPAQHDATLATMSHLPHVLAYAMMQQVLDDADPATLLDNAGTGFRDFTRLASSQPEMWRDILLSNRDALLAAMDCFDASARRLREAIERSDAGRLDALFTRSRTERDAWLARFEARAKDGA